MPAKGQLESQNKPSAVRSKKPAETDLQALQMTVQEEEALAQVGSAAQAERPTSAIEPPINPAQRQRNFARLQRVTGNQKASRLARQVQRKLKPASLQRHPEGATLLGGAATTAGIDTDAVSLPEAGATAAPAAGATAAPTTVPATSPAAGTSAGPAADTTTAPAVGPAADRPTTTTPTGALPIPVGLPTLQVSYSQDAITRSFGSTAGRAIVTGTIHTVPNLAGLYAEYDRLCIRDNITNPDTGVTWVAGDAERSDRTHGVRTNAFAYQGEVWLDLTQTDPTAMVHEMLHVNTASDYRSTVGEVINEGTTQRLAVKAIQARGDSVAGSENTYQREQQVVEALVQFVGEPVLVSAYFNGAATLVSAYEAFHGSRSWAILKRVLDGARNDATAFDRALRMLRPPSVDQRVAVVEALGEEGGSAADRELLTQMVSGWSTADRIAVVNSFLDWWVSDTDLDMIETIVHASAGDRDAIATAIQPRIRSLISLGQRTRLRLILGVV